MAVRKILALAAATRRVGYVYLIGGQLKDWRVSGKAAKSPTEAAGQIQKWINELKPDVVVTEKVKNSTKKSAKTKSIIAAMANVASHNYLHDVSVTRPREYKNKYAEAVALAERYPDITAWLPTKRRLFEAEPRNTVLFEALALADELLRGSGPTLARALG